MKKINRIITILSLLSILVLGAAPVPQTPSDADINLWQILSSLLYGVIGVVLFYLAYIVFDRFLNLDLRRELVVDQNKALGIMLAGLFIGIGILVAAVIN